MLKRPPLNASPTASPARMYGVDQISVSEMESARPSEPCQSPPYASSGSPPVTQISSAQPPARSARRVPVPTASAPGRDDSLARRKAPPPGPLPTNDGASPGYARPLRV